MSVDRQLSTAAADLLSASRTDSEPESMLRHLKRTHRRRRAAGGATVGLVLVAALTVGAIAWTGHGVDRTLPTTPPSPTPSVSEKSEHALLGCDVQCQWDHGDAGFRAPGPVPAGDYTTTWFFPGQLTVTFPDGWSVLQDTTGDLTMSSDADRDGTIQMWLDVTPISGRRVAVTGLPVTPDAIVGWLAANPDVTATSRGNASLGASSGQGLVARVVDLQVSKTAKNYGGKNCPSSACVYLFAMDGQWTEAGPADGLGDTATGWAISRGDDYVRLYVAHVGTGDHLLYVMVDAPTPERRDALDESFAPILDSLTLPPGSS